MNERNDSLAHEAALLIETVRTVLRYTSASGDPGPGDVWSEATSSGPSGSATWDTDCRLCPFCQLLRHARHTRPAMFAHLVAASDEVLAAVREAFGAHQRAWTGGGCPGAGRIDVDEGD